MSDKYVRAEVTIRILLRVNEGEDIEDIIEDELDKYFVIDDCIEIIESKNVEKCGKCGLDKECDPDWYFEGIKQKCNPCEKKEKERRKKIPVDID